MRAVLSYRLQCKSQQLFCPQIFHLSRRGEGSPLLRHLESAGDVQPGAWNYLKVWSLMPWTDAASRLRPQLGLPARTHTCSLPTWPALPQNEEAGSRAESPGERARRKPSVCHDLVWRVTPPDSHACCWSGRPKHLPRSKGCPGGVQQGSGRPLRTGRAALAISGRYYLS